MHLAATSTIIQRAPGINRKPNPLPQPLRAAAWDAQICKITACLHKRLLTRWTKHSALSSCACPERGGERRWRPAAAPARATWPAKLRLPRPAGAERAGGAAIARPEGGGSREEGVAGSREGGSGERGGGGGGRGRRPVSPGSFGRPAAGPRSRHAFAARGALWHRWLVASAQARERLRHGRRQPREALHDDAFRGVVCRGRRGPGQRPGGKRWRGRVRQGRGARRRRRV